jgi:hypothetical protein
MKSIIAIVICLTFVAIFSFASPPMPKPPTPAILVGNCLGGDAPNIPTGPYSWTFNGLGLNAQVPCLSSNGDTRFPETALVVPSSGTLKNLTVSFRYQDVGINPGAPFQIDTTVQVNSAPTPLTCSITLSGGSSIPTFPRCSDNIHTFTVSAGDLIQVISSNQGGSYCHDVDNLPCPQLQMNVSLEKE